MFLKWTSVAKTYNNSLEDQRQMKLQIWKIKRSIIIVSLKFSSVTNVRDNILVKIRQLDLKFWKVIDLAIISISTRLLLETRHNSLITASLKITRESIGFRMTLDAYFLPKKQLKNRTFSLSKYGIKEWWPINYLSKEKPIQKPIILANIH